MVTASYDRVEDRLRTRHGWNEIRHDSRHNFGSCFAFINESTGSVLTVSYSDLKSIYDGSDVRQFIECHECGFLLTVGAFPIEYADHMADGNVRRLRFCSDECYRGHQHKTCTGEALDALMWERFDIERKPGEGDAELRIRAEAEAFCDRMSDSDVVAAHGREKFIDAQLLFWERIDGVRLPREHAAKRVDALAAEVVTLMKTLNAVADGWETKADRRAI